MLVTPFQVLRVPPQYKDVVKRHVVASYNSAIEVIAWLNGEDVDRRSFANRVIRELGSDMVENLLVLGAKEPVESKKIHLLSNDGVLVIESELYLRRRFQYIDDYLSTFPDMVSVPLPFTRLEIHEAIEPEMNTSSPINIQCLSYLNPKDPMYYFLRTTVSVPPDQLLERASLLSEKQKTGLIEARRLNSREGSLPPLPNEGRGDVYLACIFEIHRDLGNLIHFFSEYPSYLTLQSTKVESTFIDLLTNTDYSKSDETQTISNYLTDLLRRRIDDILTSTTSKDLAKILLAMRVCKRKLFENEDPEVTTPYSVSLRGFFPLNQTNPLLINIAALFNTSTVEVYSVLL